MASRPNRYDRANISNVQSLIDGVRRVLRGLENDENRLPRHKHDLLQNLLSDLQTVRTADGNQDDEVRFFFLYVNLTNNCNPFVNKL